MLRHLSGQTRHIVQSLMRPLWKGRASFSRFTAKSHTPSLCPNISWLPTLASPHLFAYRACLLQVKSHRWWSSALSGSRVPPWGSGGPISTCAAASSSGGSTLQHSNPESHEHYLPIRQNRQHRTELSVVAHCQQNRSASTSINSFSNALPCL